MRNSWLIILMALMLVCSCRKDSRVQTDLRVFSYTSADSAVMSRLLSVKQIKFIVSDSIHSFNGVMEAPQCQVEHGSSSGYTSDPQMTGVRPVETPWLKVFFYDSLHNVTFWLHQYMNISDGGSFHWSSEVDYYLYFGNWRGKDLLNNSRFLGATRYLKQSWDEGLHYYDSLNFHASWLGKRTLKYCYAYDYSKIADNFLEQDNYYSAAYDSNGFPVFYCQKGTPPTYGIYGPFGKYFVFEQVK